MTNTNSAARKVHGNRNASKSHQEDEDRICYNIYIYKQYVYCLENESEIERERE